MHSDIAARIEHVKARIRRAAEAVGRDPASVRLVAVAKTFTAEEVRRAAAAGATDVGENYIQEAREKFDALAGLGLRMFELIHTVDSARLAVEIDRAAAKMGKRQGVLVQVNVAGEATKSGVAPEAAAALVREIAGMEAIRVRGLMTMPPYFDAPERVRPFFAELRRIAERIRDLGLPGVATDELSMGMTGDFEAAIAEGATLVRVGTAIFGGRA